MVPPGEQKSCFLQSGAAACCDKLLLWSVVQSCITLSVCSNVYFAAHIGIDDSKDLIKQWGADSLESQQEADERFKRVFETSEKFRKANIHVHTIPKNPDKWWKRESKLQEFTTDYKYPYDQGYGKMHQCNSNNTGLEYTKHMIEKRRNAAKQQHQQQSESA
eukprot:19483-Heterococcus_DN1.PRE.4